MKPERGEILWWSERDGNGVIVDPLGNELYFDSSVVDEGDAGPVDGAPVEYVVNRAVKDCLCARDVVVLEGGAA